MPIWPLSPWFDSSLHPHPYDRAAAARLLAAAGWERARAGALRRRQGHPCRLRLLVARESHEMHEVAGLLKTELQAAGVHLEVKVGDFGFIKTQLERGRFDMALLGVALRPQSDLSPLLHSKGRLNLGRYDNPAADRLLDSVRATSEEGTRTRYLRQLGRLLHQDLPFLILYAPVEIMVVSREIHGIANNGRRPAFSALSR